MCGIVGFLGHRQACPLLVEGLEKLAYRGYDSAGVALLGADQTIIVRKTKGKVAKLKEMVQKIPAPGLCGIGHTRWATHGKPSDENAHPHTDMNGEIAVVHNGMIENAEKLRCELQNQGCVFASETDTEVIAHLLKVLYNGDMLQTIVEVLQKLKGSYALGILCCSEPDKLFFVRCGSPLIAAFRNDEGMIASDVPALLSFSRDVVYLQERQIGVLTSRGMHIYDEFGKNVPYETAHMEWEQTSAEKNGYAHFMLKEIYEQPAALRDAAAGKYALNDDRWFPLDAEEISRIEKVTIVACGTAYHAGVLGSYAIEKLAHIPSRAEIASEYRYRAPLIQKNELIIAISQSGETADTLAAVREAVNRHVRVLALCNTVGSSLARMVGEENTLYTCAGPEIAVASTKAYVTQAEMLILIAAVLGKSRRRMSQKRTEQLYQSISRLPDSVFQALKQAEYIKRFAARMKEQDYLIFTGRYADYPLAMEAALKLKEISYIFCQAYPAGEFKHGPIALVKPGQAVIAVVTQDCVVDKMLANLQEIRARGAVVLAVCTQKLSSKLASNVDEVVVVPDTDECLVPIVAAIPLQLFAYYMAVERGCDVDQPRNLAKSVTVE